MLRQSFLKLGYSARNLRLAKLPKNARSFAVAVEAKQGINLAPVEPIYRVVQPGRRIDVVPDGQRIVNVVSPALFFEHAQNRFLVARRHAEPLDY